jgi:ribosomal protein S18 acetylase RimI-like enzyme
MTISVRPVRKKDADDIIRLYRAFEAYLKSLGDKPALKFTKKAFLRDGFGADPAFIGWVAVQDKEIIGYLLGNFVYYVDKAQRVFFVADLFVDASYRRDGVGHLLMYHAAVYAKKRRADGMSWDVFKPNKTAFRFYRKLGGKKSDHLAVMFLEAGSFQRLARRG